MKASTTPEYLRFLRANGHELGALTGTDHRALAAIAALLTLYSYSRHARVLVAVRLALLEMQVTTRDLAKPLIAWAMDWSDVEPIWNVVTAASFDGRVLLERP